MTDTPVCGDNNTLPARFVGCGIKIESWPEVYRCTHCGVPFHRQCADKHFADDNPLTEWMVEQAINEGYPK